MSLGISSIPTETIIAYAGIFIGTALASIFWYLKNYKAPAPARQVAEELVLTSGVIGDMAPVREAAGHLKEIARLMDEGVDEMKKSRHVWEKISQRLETNAEIDSRFAAREDRRNETR